MPRIAFLFMAYKNPAQVERVIQSLSYPDVDFYIHLDKKIDLAPFAYLEKLENVYLIKSRVLINWGTYSLTRGILLSVQEIQKGRTDYRFFGFISGQDYPIRPIKELYLQLDSNPETNMISFLPQGHPWYEEAHLRINSYSCNELPIFGKYKLESFLNTFFKKFRYTYPLPIYGAPGSAFMILTKECTQYLINKINKNKRMAFHLELTWGPDEFLFQTLIMHSPFKDKVLVNALYYMNWKDGGLHPKTFTKKDFSELEQRGEFLARKFDLERDKSIMDLLDLRLNSQTKKT